MPPFPSRSRDAADGAYATRRTDARDSRSCWSGRCWLEIDGAGAVLLDRGDFVLLPSTPAFAMYSHPNAGRIHRQPSDAAIRHGDPDGEPDFQMLGGAFRIEPVNAPLLLALLPRMIHIRAAEGDTGRLGRIIELIGEECAADSPGRDMILERLLEVMLVECLRSARPSRERTSGRLAGRNAGPGFGQGSSGHPCRCSSRMERSRARETCRNVAVGLCGPVCEKPRLRSDGICFALADGTGTSRTQPRRKVAGPPGGRDRL